jgi:Amt family ammonium transporter
LAGVIVLGARKGKYTKDGKINAIPGANLPLATLGTFILWMGWFGFNGGSVLASAEVVTANEVAVVFMNTNMAASGGAIGALILSKILFKKADLTMLLNGALAGLVSITAGPDWSTPFVATLIGMAGGVLVVLSILALDRLKIDDPVGAISVHGTCGIWGVLAVTFGGASFVTQLIGVGVIFAWVFGVSLIVWLILKFVMGIRVSEEVEYAGVDVHECGMEAYPEFTTSSK